MKGVEQIYDEILQEKRNERLCIWKYNTPDYKDGHYSQKYPCAFCTGFGEYYNPDTDNLEICEKYIPVRKLPYKE